jgi:hypothetical protein
MPSGHRSNGSTVRIFVHHVPGLDPAQQEQSARDQLQNAYGGFLSG